MAFNLSQMEKGLRAAQGQVDLLCFSETFLQGFDALTWSYETDRQVAVAQTDPVIRQLCALTRQYGVDLLFGYVEREEDRLYSSCMVIENGTILHNYRRMSTGWKEVSRTDAHYCEGATSQDFLYKGMKLRIALCGDLWDLPEAFRTDGVLIWPIYVNFTRAEWAEYEQDYAQQAHLAAEQALLVNAITDEPLALGGAFHFQSGAIADRLPYEQEDILMVEVTPAAAGPCAAN